MATGFVHGGDNSQFTPEKCSSTSAKSFFVHHTQQLSAAAQVGDAKGIRKKITEMKMRLIKDALKATGQG